MQAARRRRETRIERAEGHLAFARQEAEVGYKDSDERRIRDSAEKTWLAVCEAVDHAMESHGKAPPVGPHAHSERREFLERFDLSLAKDMAYFAEKLHGDCFYSARCPTKMGMMNAMEEAEQFLRRVKNL